MVSDRHVAEGEMSENPGQAGTGHSGSTIWIVNPLFDVLFVLGGGVVILLLLNYACMGSLTPPTRASGPAAPGLLLVAWLGQHLLFDSHNAATYLRIWDADKSTECFRFHKSWLLYSCAPLFVAGLLNYGFACTLVYLYVLSVFAHVAIQALELALIYCRKRKYLLVQTEEKILRWFVYCLAVFFAIRMLTFPERYSPVYFLGLTMPKWPPLAEGIYSVAFCVLIVLSLAVAGVLLRKLIREQKLPPLPATLLMLMSACFGFAENTTSGVIWFYVPAFFHGSQYLSVSLADYLDNRGIPVTASPARWLHLGGKHLLKYLALVVLIGSLLYVGVPTLMGDLGFDQALVAVLILAVVNYHQFITDLSIWHHRRGDNIEAD